MKCFIASSNLFWFISKPTEALDKHYNVKK